MRTSLDNSEVHFLPRLGPKGPPQRVGYRVDPDTGCWNWTGYVEAGGYGLASGRRAHRVAWERLVGPIPPGHDLHHKCGNRRCVNPEHLQPRFPREHRGRNGRLTDEQLNTILRMLRAGHDLADIAEATAVEYLRISGLKLGGLFRRV
jgi:hypothetical protein